MRIKSTDKSKYLKIAKTFSNLLQNYWRYATINVSYIILWSARYNKIRKVIIMTKGTKDFRIIIRILLALTMIISAFFAFVSCLDFAKDPYGIYVAGIAVSRDNDDDILGDGTVYYDESNNILTFNNATIEYDDTVVYSKIDINIHLIGENKFICTNQEYAIGVFAGDYNLYKDLAIIGDGSLTIELPNAIDEAVGLAADNLTVATDLTVKAYDCEKMVNGIVCTSDLIVASKATVTVNSGSATKYSSAVRVRGNAFFEEGTTLKASTNSDTTGICKGLTVSGDVFLGKDTTLEVSIDDSTTDLGECIRVSGLMEIGIGSTVTASAKKTYAIECFGAIEANNGASISASSEKKDLDIFCSGAVINHGATFDGEIDAIGGIHNRD